VVIFQSYPESGVRQGIDNLAFKFDMIFLRHKTNTRQ
jgi:hypothetical protein